MLPVCTLQDTPVSSTREARHPELDIPGDYVHGACAWLCATYILVLSFGEESGFWSTRWIPFVIPRPKLPS